MEHLRDKMQIKDKSDFSVTYKLNRINGIFNWYPYTEGFSKPFVDKMFEYFGVTSSNLVMDPFSGCGTTALAGTLKGCKTISIEVNPFMHFIGKTKIGSLNLGINQLHAYLKKIKDTIPNTKKISIPPFLEGKSFFQDDNLEKALIIKESIIKSVPEGIYRDFFLLHISSLLVKISNMIRAVDLRYRKIKQGSLDVFSLFFEKAEKSIQDLLALDISPKIDPAFYNEDICNISHKLKQFQRKIDFLITSPPYLNGTNYDRNTKLEMGFLEMIKTDMDLRN